MSTRGTASFRVTLFGLSVALIVGAAGFTTTRFNIASAGDIALILVFVGSTVLVSIVEFLTTSVRRYFGLLLVHVALTAVGLVWAHIEFNSALCLLSSLIISIAVLNPVPANFILATGCAMVVLAIRFVLLSLADPDRAGLISSTISLGIVAVLVAVPLSALVGYRERWIDGLVEQDRLEKFVARLARANLEFQDYASSAAALSSEAERKRITRDIHDIVGYTLTNNITMMEAIIDLIHQNPLGVVHVVDEARANAQDGLKRVRDALYLLRDREARPLHGRESVEQLMNVCRRATGMQVELVFSDIHWDFPPELDKAFYHVVQESLINAFSHGRASVIRIFLSADHDLIELKVVDNGIGNEVVQEGIGLSGMRERLTALGGGLRCRNSEIGFEVVATVPRHIAGKKTAGDSPHG